MVKKYILTGGPGTGKSSLVLALEARGEYVIREAAEDCIKLKQAMGVQEPWAEPGFQDGILALQLQRESRIPKSAGRVFLDRGLYDGLAYVLEGTPIYQRVLQKAQQADYDKIFLVEQLGFTEKTAVRKENHDEALALGEKLEAIYRRAGYPVIRIEKGMVEERVQQILEHI